MLEFLQVLQKAGLPDAQLMHLSTQVFQLQCAFERMALVKEYRYCTPKFPVSLASACTCCLLFLWLCCPVFKMCRIRTLVWQLAIGQACVADERPSHLLE